MTYAIQLSPATARELRKFDPPAKRLVGGAGERRVRSGDYRIIHEIHDSQLHVLVLRMPHRREVYER